MCGEVRNISELISIYIINGLFGAYTVMAERTRPQIGFLKKTAVKNGEDILTSIV